MNLSYTYVVERVKVVVVERSSCPISSFRLQHY